MELLLSNIQPLRTSFRDAATSFNESFQLADGIRLASGYISSDSIADLKNVFEVNNKSYLELIIGMHGFEGFTRIQYEAAKFLDDYLRSKKAGEVKIVTAFKFHGKVYSFLKNNTPFAGIIGSSNLGSIFDNQNNYETDLLLNEQKIVSEINNFITNLSARACTPFSQWEVKEFIESKNTQLDGHENVDKVSKEELANILSKRSKVVFKIPIKADEAQKSNLNAYFGKGREDQKGIIKPRHWYEVELIVPKSITDDPAYPKAGKDEESTITVYTDDGFRFRCKISGDYSKNFRSDNDLKILGRWIKGRLELNGALKIGEPVTSRTLERYGRDNFDFIGTSDPSIWLLNFGV